MPLHTRTIKKRFIYFLSKVLGFNIQLVMKKRKLKNEFNQRFGCYLRLGISQKKEFLELQEFFANQNLDK